MKPNLHKLLIVLTLAISTFGLLVPSSTVIAVSTDPCNAQLPEAVREANGCNGSKDALPNLIINILNVVIGVAGIIAVIFIIIGGYQYMTSTGDPGKVKKAKDTLMYAIIGLVVCILAAAIVNFVIVAATS